MSMIDRHFLFLQGMPSLFYTELANRLESEKALVSRINLCFGDWLFWQRKGAVNYRGTLENWPRYFEGYLIAHRVTDLVLLGEQRKYHKEAVSISQQHGVRVIVNDFGYLRPDWLTFELDGMSGCSRFPKDPAVIRQESISLPPVDFPARYVDSNFMMGLGDVVYMYGTLLFHWLYPGYERSDARLHPLIYSASGLLRSITKRRREKKSALILGKLLDEKAQFFVYPLQLAHDFQLIAYSPFANQSEAIDKVIKSFATLPEAYKLVIKSHPWDPGLQNWERVVAQVAKQYGCAHRVFYMDGGDLNDMMASSLGVVTVNSTSGLQALRMNKPVKTLGQAIYDVAGLTHQGNIDDFWLSRISPGAELLDSFLKLLTARYQVRGSFFSRSGRKAAVDGACNYLKMIAS